MNMLKGDYTDLIRFIPAENKKAVHENKGKIKQLNPGLSGSEAKEFYESLVANDGGDKTSSKCTQKEKRKRKHSSKCTNDETRADKSKFNSNEFLKCAQYGKLKEINKLLERGIPVDICDSFGWTALMCAAYEGRVDVVSCLLKHGANVDLCDGQGKNAYLLASGRGHGYILDVIDKHKKHNSCDEDVSVSHNSKQNKSFTCHVCKSEFKDCPKKQHETSTVHLFNLKLKPKPDRYLIPATNVGYQLMRKSGWDGEHGLGSSGQGQRYPVKTVLKKDRKCLGNDSDKKQKAKITHFGPNDTSSVRRNPINKERKLSVKTLSKKAKLARARKEKRWEQNLRLYFNSE